ncbi:MAG: glycosyltransferase family 2 protein [Deltaproteobacteria bacterium]|nr:glycosyltransferase family 2 protein [Deltaproteobacteria bacterium]
MSGVQIICTMAAAPALFAGVYLLLLTLASRRTSAPPLLDLPLRFTIVVPAHNEARGIAETVKNLRALAWPPERFRVLVLADNCSDDTANRARAAGAQVIERIDRANRGKGYALQLAFDHLLGQGWADAMVVVDADTLVSPNLLRAFAAQIGAGAQAVQADYRVRNVDDAWRTRLMAIAFGAFHTERSLARERLGLSCGLRGNGMCFTAGTLRAVPHLAFSLVEDLEYGLRLGEAGVRVHHAVDAQVFGEMVAGERASRSQRLRWERGRRALARTRGPTLLARALVKRSALLLDLAIDLLLPPLASLALYSALGLIAALMFGGGALAIDAFSFTLFAIALHVVRGWQLSGTGARGLADLLRAPVYLLWKLGLALRRPTQRPTSWVRTARGGESP